MYLKALEISGFKSFADKKRFDFEPGISCIVGPNGCGKSNVVDSVRWAIGEMSWKSLRSSSMVDIIFNGTAKRAPLNMAQVTMIFDNTSRKLPLDFNEITVSRKIFRSGESEYFLNKVQCRLRDIRDLFLDTGIGGEGYAIIDQGGVESILSASPVQRREMFEEVAGVSKYKAKREEALHRLDRVDMDIARLSDTIALLDEQIKKLDSEAKKARLYQKYREELKESEIAISIQSIKEFDAGIAKDAAVLEPLIKEIEDINAAISAEEGVLAAMDLNLTHKQKEFSAFNEQTSAIKYQIGLLEGQIKNCESMTAELKAQVAYSSKESETGALRLKELEPALASLKEKLAAADGEIAPVQQAYNNSASELNRNEEEVRRTDSETNRLNNAAMEAMQAELECSNKIALEESSAALEQDNLVTLEKSGSDDFGKIAAFKKDIEDLNSKINESQSALEALRGKLSAKETEIQQLQTRRGLLSDQIAGVKASKAALMAKLDMIQTQGKNNAYWVGAKLVRESGISGVGRTLRQNLKFAPEHAVLVEEALGRFLDAVVCDSFEAASNAVEYLKTKGNARCNFIILNAVPAGETGGGVKNFIKYAPELENLLSYLTRGSDAQGTDLKGIFWLSGGSADIKAPEAYWGEEESAKEEIETKNREEQKISGEISKNTAKISSEEEALRAFRQKFQEDSIALNTLKNAAASKTNEIKTIENTLNMLDGRKEELRKKIEEKKTSAQELRNKLAQLKQTQAASRAQVEEVKAKKAALLQEAEVLRRKTAELNSSLYELKLKKNNIELDLKSANIEYENILSSAKKRDELIESSNTRIKNLADEKLAAEVSLKDNRDKLAELEITQTKLSSELAELKKEFDDKTAALTARRKAVSDMQIKAHDLENALINYRRQRTTIVNHLMDSWNITPEEAVMKFDGKEIDHERVKMMRKRIENMGAVNMTAPEEYDALTQRNTFLKQQIDDLTSAKADLKNAIAKINATTRENFKYTFEQVRAHFKNIYRTLFKGGEADLVLTDPENLLETGIEIFAQPPGKKLLNISSMSGGEKTLTALALLFAFFTHNPSPFCIMDEADAALDEANIERFVNLIKEFSLTTQFVVVTHNKRTMEAAQTLYGITMEESGVSKFMSVNLKDREQAAQITA